MSEENVELVRAHIEAWRGEDARVLFPSSTPTSSRMCPAPAGLTRPSLAPLPVSAKGRASLPPPPRALILRETNT